MRIKQLVIHGNLSQIKKQNSPNLFYKETICTVKLRPIACLELRGLNYEAI